MRSSLYEAFFILQNLFHFQNIYHQHRCQFHQSEQSDQVDHCTLRLADLDLVEQEGKCHRDQKTAVEIGEDLGGEEFACKGREAIEQGEDDRSGGDGQTIVGGAHAANLGTAIFLAYVKVRQTNKTCQNVQRHYGEIKIIVKTITATNDRRQYAKADKVGKRVDLNTESLFVIGAFFASTGNDTVEKIKKSA